MVTAWCMRAVRPIWFHFVTCHMHLWCVRACGYMVSFREMLHVYCMVRACGYLVSFCVGRACGYLGSLRKVSYACALFRTVIPCTFVNYFLGYRTTRNIEHEIWNIIK